MNFWGERLFRCEFRGESTQFRSEITKFAENFGVNFHFGVKDFSARDGIETDSGFEPNRKRVFFGNFLPGSSNDYFNLVKHTNGVITQ